MLCSLLNILIAWLVSHQRSRPSASSLSQNSVPTLNKTSTSVSMKVDADHLHVRNRRSTFMNEPPTVLTDKIRCTLCFQAANWFQGYFYNSSAQKQHTRPPTTLSLLQLPQFMPQTGQTGAFVVLSLWSSNCSVTYAAGTHKVIFSPLSGHRAPFHCEIFIPIKDEQ